MFRGGAGATCPRGCRTPTGEPAKETQNHLLGQCRQFHDFYVKRSDGVTNRVFRFLTKRAPGLTFTYRGVASTNRKPAFPPEVLRAVPRAAGLHPDVVLQAPSGDMEVLEVAVTSHLETAFREKTAQYADLCREIREATRRRCQYRVLLFDPTGTIPRHTYAELVAALAVLQRRAGEADDEDGRPAGAAIPAGRAGEAAEEGGRSAEAAMLAEGGERAGGADGDHAADEDASEEDDQPDEHGPGHAAEKEKRPAAVRKLLRRVSGALTESMLALFRMRCAGNGSGGAGRAGRAGRAERADGRAGGADG